MEWDYPAVYLLKRELLKFQTSEAKMHQDKIINVRNKKRDLKVKTWILEKHTHWFSCQFAF